MAYGQTVLKRALLAAGLSYDDAAAHSARYDTEQTADLFCQIVNQFQPIFEAATGGTTDASVTDVLS